MKYVKTVDDYLPQLLSMFPLMPFKDIKRIVEYGWRMFYYYNLIGCDTLIVNPKSKLWMYCGRLRNDSVEHFLYYTKKLARKIRVMYLKKKIKWDGYYYIGLTKLEYEDYIKDTVKRGRKKKKFKFGNKVAYKIFDEAKLRYLAYKCILKYKYPVDLGFSYYKEGFTCENPEIALIRESHPTFKDITINENNYEFV